jgi:hypothetical protein
MSPKTSNNGFLFPLYLFSDAGKRSENLSLNFHAFIDSRYEHHCTPEEILGYIYAILHAPTYRARFAEFLRGDFPRVPFPKSADDFEKLSKLGWALVQAHLLREVPRKGLAAYHGKGNHKIDAVRYSPEEKAVSINETQFFESVPQTVWDFHIGGYQVLDKYLKSRKGRALSLDEINQVGAIADSVAFTIGHMAKIDKAYQTAFAERGLLRGSSRTRGPVRALLAEVIRIAISRWPLTTTLTFSKKKMARLSRTCSVPSPRHQPIGPTPTR